MASRLMAQERRGTPRIAEQVTLAITEAGGVIQAETKNLSASGVYCALDRLIPPMTKLEVRLELPRGHRRASVRCSGVVVRVEPVIAPPDRARYHTAIFFTDLAERDRSAISQFVRRQLAARSSTG